MRLRFIIVFFSFLWLKNSYSQTIVLDPGHGYCNDCTQNCTSNVRSDIEILTAMSVGNKLTNLLNNCPTVTTYMTRTTSDCGDFPSLSQRAAMSNSWGADRFLSIHCNAGGGSGTETFWCDNSSSSNIACQNFATEIQNQMVTYGDWNSRRVVEDHSYLNFHLGVLSPTNAVGCLSEIGFVDSADATKLVDDNWRNEFAQAYYIALQNDLGISTCSNLDCSSAIELTCGVTYNGASSTASSNIETYGCNNWTETGPERVHTITPISNGPLTASLSNFTGDLDVYILGSCDPTDCLGTVSSSSATYANAIAGNTYYIVVDADDGSGSAYDLTATCPTEDVFISDESLNTNIIAPGYDITTNLTQNYSGSITTTYNSYLYFYLSSDCTIDGGDTLLSNQLYSELSTNNTSDIINANLTIPSITTPGNYNILITSDATNVVPEENETNNIVCLPITIISPQLDCASAIEITCNTTYNGTSSSNSSYVESYSCNTWTESGPERIHTITPQGNGEITATLSNFTGDLDVYILGSCDPTDCLGTVSSSSATFTNAIAGNTYYIVVDADDGSGSAYDLFVSCPTPSQVQLSPKVFLQGAMLNNGGGNLMRDDLRVADIIPTTSPYVDSLTCNATVFDVTGNDAIVDWIWIELRDKNDNTSILHSTSALLQRDGDIVATDGTSVLSFNAQPDNYYIAIKHRNHLGIMSSNTANLSNTITTVDFTDANNQITYGTNAQTTIGLPNGVVAMWGGDVNGDGVIQYTGANADTPNILTNVLNDAGNILNFPTFIVNGYTSFDINMNGGTQYTGGAADSPFILQNALSHPGNFLNFATYSINEQLP